MGVFTRRRQVDEFDVATDGTRASRLNLPCSTKQAQNPTQSPPGSGGNDDAAEMDAWPNCPSAVETGR